MCRHERTCARVARCLAGAGALLAALPGAAAQRRFEGPGGIRIEGIHGALRVEGEYRDEKRDNANTSLAESEWGVRESLELRFLGSVYHPRLLEFDLGFDLGLEQRGIRGSGTRSNQSVNGSNVEFDLRTRILKEHPYSFELFGHRQETATRQTFFETTEAVILEAGFAAFAKGWWIPSNLRFSHYRYDGRGADTHEETRDSVALNGIRVDDANRIDYTVELNDVRLGDTATSFRDYSANVSTTQSLDDAGDSLAATVFYRLQQGDISSLYVTGNANLHLRWSETLDTDHGVRVDQSDAGSSAAASTDTVELYSRAQHALFESLRSGGELRWTDTDFGDGSTTRLEATGDVAYRKKTFFGRLFASYRPDVFVQDDQTGSRPVGVLDETHRFTPGRPVFLTNFGVDETTIVVTDATGLTLFVQPRDYRVANERGRTRLDIPVGSRILAGATILVDYSFLPNPSKRFRSVAQTATAGIRISDFASLDVGWSSQRQTLLAGTDAGTLDNTRSRRVAVSLFRWGQTLSAEYENRDSLFTPFERVEVRAASAYDPFADLSLLASVSGYRARFKGEAERERGLNANFSGTWTIGRPAQLMLRAEYRNMDVRVDKGRGWLVEGRFAYRFRQSEVTLRLQWSDERFEIASDQRLGYALLAFRRRF